MLKRMTQSVFAVFTVSALVLVLDTAGPAWAQSQAAGGALEGTVSDQSGGVLPGATVSIRNAPG